MSVNLLPFAVLASEDQGDPKLDWGGCVTTNRCSRVLIADVPIEECEVSLALSWWDGCQELINFTHVCYLFSCTAAGSDQATHGDGSCEPNDRGFSQLG